MPSYWFLMAFEAGQLGKMGKMMGIVVAKGWAGGPQFDFFLADFIMLYK